MKSSSKWIVGGLIAGALGFAAISAYAFDGPYGPGYGRHFGGPGMMMGQRGPGRMMGMVCRGGSEEFVGRMIDRVERTIEPTAEQKPLVDAVRTAVGKASADMKTACDRPDTRPTPPERLAMAEKHLSVALAAIKEVRPSVDALYASLNDDQKQKLADMRRGGPRGWRGRGRHRGGPGYWGGPQGGYGPGYGPWHHHGPMHHQGPWYPNGQWQ